MPVEVVGEDVYSVVIEKKNCCWDTNLVLYPFPTPATERSGAAGLSLYMWEYAKPFSASPKRWLICRRSMGTKLSQRTEPAPLPPSKVCMFLCIHLCM